ncbi:hypothetical protein [Actinomadura rupiterrae]|uniref:hypothetical protein n=1 Tax=Actinomadura rupiterrae TaxID=559627 RepID=UPI0020A320C4|nr:hypothetical protein [Actinomadura rupiterrae]MCP2340658.1 hypothetical protein [Actinomadura rupiterrae]
MRDAAAFIAESGIVAELERYIARERGRPRTCTVEGLLVGMALCAHRTGGVLFTQVTEILHWGIPEDWRRRFGLVDRVDNARGFAAAYRVVLRLTHRLLDELNPSPLPMNRRLPVAVVEQIIQEADSELLAQRRERLHKVIDAILGASIAAVRHRLDEHWDGSLGVDATPIATWARGVEQDGPVTATDPDAGWYVREGDHRAPDLHSHIRPTKSGSKRNPRKKRSARRLFGYDANLAIAYNPHHDPRPQEHGCGDPRLLPALVLSMRLDKPGHNPGSNGVTMLKSIKERGHPVGYVAGDRLYNGSNPNAWQLPVRALGYDPVYDYRKDQLGSMAQADGALLVEGTWCCPSTPQRLIDATRDLQRAAGPKKIDPETWVERIHARAHYLLPRKGLPGDQGQQRYMCPAAAGKVQCPLKPASMGTDPRLPLVDPRPSPVSEPPPICKQGSITIGSEDGAKHWQAHPYGSPIWQKLYFRLRNAVEGFNGFAKDDAQEAIERAQKRRIRGVAAQSLVLAFQLARVNQRKISAWIDTLPGEDGQPRRRARRRKYKPLGTWTPKGHLDEVA